MLLVTLVISLTYFTCEQEDRAQEVDLDIVHDVDSDSCLFVKMMSDVCKNRFFLPTNGRVGELFLELFFFFF